MPGIWLARPPAGEILRALWAVALAAWAQPLPTLLHEGNGADPQRQAPMVGSMGSLPLQP